MKFEYRSFSGKTFRPQPKTFTDSHSKFFAILTPWGPQHQTQNMLDSLFENYKNFQSDQEMTFVIPQLKSLSKEENILRTAVLNFNHQVHKSLNSESESLFGYELVCGVIEERKIHFIQIGHPYIYLNRAKIPLQPLGHVLDLSGGFSEIPKKLPPLPSQLLGVYPDIHASVFTIPITPKDGVLFLSRAFVPSEIAKIPQSKRTLEDISQILSKDDSDMPFWIGLLNH